MITENWASYPAPANSTGECPREHTAAVARLWVCGVLRNKRIVRVPYLLRGHHALLRLYRVFNEIYDIEWEWFA